MGTNEDTVGRRMMVRIRSGTSNLRIKTGRYEKPKLNKEHRTCKICYRETEDEEHFLLRCNGYAEIRKDFLKEIGQEKEMEEIKKLLLGIGTKEEINKAIRYIRRAMAKRR